jgi:hypothetical protein
MFLINIDFVPQLFYDSLLKMMNKISLLAGSDHKGMEQFRNEFRFPGVHSIDHRNSRQGGER